MALTQISTSGVKDDAITKTKIPANQIEASELADNAVDTNAIADDAVTAGKLANDIAINTTGNISGAAGTFTGDLTIPDKIVHAGDTDTAIRLGVDTVSIETAGSERLRVDSSGNLGVGTTSPISTLHLHEAGASGSPIIQFSNGDTGTTSGDGFAIGVADNESPFIYNRENTDLRFGTNNAERMRILSSGGITFNGDTAAANALDDYEEGSWTPTAFGWSATGTNSYGIQAGRYIKVGNLVTVFFHVEWSNLSNASGVLAIGGFPYTHRTSNYYGSTAVQCRYIDYTGDTVYGVYGSGYGTSILLYAQNDNGNHQYVAIDGAGRVEGTVTYLAG